MSVGEARTNDSANISQHGFISAAHELKSPLALIRLLTIELANETDLRRREIITTQIRLTTEKSLRLTTDLTRARTLQTELLPTESLQVKPVLDEVIHDLQPLYAAHSRRLSISRRATIPAIIANRDLLRRVLSNFADNALHYTDEESVVELFMHLQRNSQTVRIGVRDIGPTLPTAIWRSVRSKSDISPYFQDANRPASSGLGLQIVHKFAQSMNGSIGAVRHRKGGTSFYIELPISRQLSLL